MHASTVVNEVDQAFCFPFDPPTVRASRRVVRVPFPANGSDEEILDAARKRMERDAERAAEIERNSHPDPLGRLRFAYDRGRRPRAVWSKGVLALTQTKIDGLPFDETNVQDALRLND